MSQTKILDFPVTRKEPVDWDYIRLRYELFGDSPNTLAAMHSVDLPFLENRLLQENWTRRVLPGAIEGIQDSDSLDELEKAVKDTRTLLTLHKDAYIMRYLLELEVEIIRKAKVMLNSLTSDRKDVFRLTALAKLFSLIKENNSKDIESIPPTSASPVSYTFDMGE